jgi:hypothetical protein
VPTELVQASCSSERESVTTPLGRPVEPEVKTTTAGASGPVGADRSAAPVAARSTDPAAASSGTTTDGQSSAATSACAASATQTVTPAAVT